MKRRKPTFDQGSYDLAEQFLSDYKGVKDEDVNELATEIQATIEAWLADFEVEYLKAKT